MAKYIGGIDMDINEKQVWSRAGKQIVRKYRCGSGPRKGKVVSSVDKCYANPDTKRRSKIMLTKARLGKVMTKRAKKTKKVNHLSKHIASMNQPGKKVR